MQNLLSGYLGGVGNMFEAHTRATNVSSKACMQSRGTLGGPQEELMAQNLKLANTTATGTYRTYKRKTRGDFLKSGVKRIHHNKHAELKISSPEGRSLGLPKKT